VRVVDVVEEGRVPSPLAGFATLPWSLCGCVLRSQRFVWPLALAIPSMLEHKLSTISAKIEFCGVDGQGEAREMEVRGYLALSFSLPRGNSAVRFLS